MPPLAQCRARPPSPAPAYRRGGRTEFSRDRESCGDQLLSTRSAVIPGEPRSGETRDPSTPALGNYRGRPSVTQITTGVRGSRLSRLTALGRDDSRGGRQAACQSLRRLGVADVAAAVAAHAHIGLLGMSIKTLEDA